MKTQSIKLIYIYTYIYITELSQNAGTVLDNQVRAIYLN